jgi:hypothetical protein
MLLLTVNAAGYGYQSGLHQLLINFYWSSLRMLIFAKRDRDDPPGFLRVLFFLFDERFLGILV